MCKIRAEITKGEAIRHISHLDYASAIERAVRRAKLPAAYSEGFNPHIKIAFASALAVGVTSAAEYMDIEFTEPVATVDFCRRMHRELPEGIEILQAREMMGKQTALMALVDLAVYEVTAAADFAVAKRAVAAFNAASEVLYLRRTPKKTKEVEIKQYIQREIEVESRDGLLHFAVAARVTPSGSVKPGEVMQALKERFGLPLEESELVIHRSGLYVKGKKPIEG